MNTYLYYIKPTHIGYEIVEISRTYIRKPEEGKAILILTERVLTPNETIQLLNKSPPITTIGTIRPTPGTDSRSSYRSSHPTNPHFNESNRSNLGIGQRDNPIVIDWLLKKKKKYNCFNINESKVDIPLQEYKTQRQLLYEKFKNFFQIDRTKKL